MSNGLNPQRKQVFCYDHVSARLSFNSEPVVYCIRAKKSGGLPSLFCRHVPRLVSQSGLDRNFMRKEYAPNHWSTMFLCVCHQACHPLSAEGLEGGVRQ
jgi:hypothetical protein